MKTKILLVTAVACLFSATASTAQTVPSYVPTIGLVGWWPFNGNANDESGNGNNGTVNGATLATDRFGNANTAHYFDGIQSYIEMNFPQSIEFSVSAWFNPAVSNPGIFGIFQHKDNCSRGGGYIIEIENNSIRFQATNCGQCGNNCANYFNFSNISNTNINQWYHVVLTCDLNGIYSIYLEDSLVHTNTNASTLSQYNVPFSVGKHHDGIDLYYFQGKIDDIGYWNRALTQQEITDLYQSSSCNVPGYVPTNGLVGWWPFCGNANDESGNGNNGTVNGATLTTDRNGNANEAYDFDGVDDFIFSQSASIPTVDTISLSVWLKPEDNFGIGEYISLGSSPNTSWGVLAGTDWNGSPYVLMNYGRGCNSNGGTNPMISPTLNNWQHIVYVSSGIGNTTLIYINGQLLGSAVNPNAGTCTSSNLYFGVDIFGPNYLNCQLDDIGIWNRALTQQEITDLYNGTSSGISDDGTWSNLSIYPNPAMDHLTVDLSGVAVDDVEQIQFLNSQGQVVATHFMDELKTVQFDTQSLSAGLYMVRIQLIDGSSVSRTVVVNK